MNYLMWSLIYLGLFIPGVNAQNPDSLAIGKVYGYVEHMPEPTFNIPDFLREQVHYPVDAVKKNIEGKSIVQFIVTDEGKVIDPKIVRSSNPLLDSESLRVVRLMPIWKPGTQNDKQVNVYYTLPISFQLEYGDVVELMHPSGKKKYVYARILPTPPVALDSFLNASMHYPEEAKSNGVGGKVTLKCGIDEKGDLISVTVVGSVYPSIDEEAVRLVNLLPRWKPAIVADTPTSVYCLVTVSFSGAARTFDTSVSNLTDTMPRMLTHAETFPETSVDILKFLQHNLRYPAIARDNNIQGTVNVRFIIDTTGKIIFVHTPEPVNIYLDQEARRVVESMPPWKPGTIDGKPVPVFFTLPIHFKLE